MSEIKEYPTINEVVESKHELAAAIGKLIKEFESKNHVIINSDITIKREYIHSGDSVGPLVYITIKI